MKYEYLNGETLNEEDIELAEDCFRLKELNGVYNTLLIAEGLDQFHFVTEGTTRDLNMDMNFKKGKLSCRSYNPFCLLWGEQKVKMEIGGHHFNEDMIIANQAFGGEAYHWDRHASVWNVYYGYITGTYSNLDVHSETIKEIAKIKNITLSVEEIKELRSISKVLTFRCLFGGGMSAAKSHFNFTLNFSKDYESCAKATMAMNLAKKYNLADSSEELIELYYKALENIGYIDLDFKYDATKDITIFYIESAVYIFAALYLWNNYGIRTILKYDSFFTDKPVTDDLMEEAIFNGMEMYREWNLPGMHSIVNRKTADKNDIIKSFKAIKDNGEEISYETIAEALKDYSHLVTPGEVCKALNIKFNGSKSRDKNRMETTKARMREIKSKLLQGIKLTGSEMVAKCNFKKNHNDLYNEIFG